MPDYLFVGKDKENVSQGTGEVHLVICHDCGSVLQINSPGICECDCKQWVWKLEGWTVNKVLRGMHA